jgi:hypothetical protein
MEYEGEMAGNELYWVALAVFEDERVFLVTGAMPLSGKDTVLDKVKKALHSFSFLQ